MARASGLKALWLAYLAQPAGDRAIYRHIRQRQTRRIMQIGLADGRRAMNLLSLAERHAAAEEIQFVGIDLFEARPAGQPAMAFKEAHKTFRALGIKSNLLPGNVFEALARCANALRDMELVLISADVDEAALTKAWFYVPRTLAANAVVMREAILDGKPAWKAISRLEIEQLAAAATPKRRAA